jgi:hypothetical protein
MYFLLEVFYLVFTFYTIKFEIDNANLSLRKTLSIRLRPAPSA